MSAQKKITNVTVTSLRKMKQAGEKIASLTSYDSSFTQVMNDEGVDVILVGDSLGMVVQGRQTTVPVTVDDIVYHSKAVASTCKRPLLMVDMPFMSYYSTDKALQTAAQLMQEGQGQMVKLEGGQSEEKIVRKLSREGVPVCAHIGLQPQLIHKLGGYRVQGRDDQQAKLMLEDALKLQEAGADALLLECVPSPLASKITDSVEIPVIGIGAGAGCDGQILVLQDILGLTPKAPKFSKDFLADTGTIQGAVRAYVEQVKDSSFPSPAYSFTE